MITGFAVVCDAIRACCTVATVLLAFAGAARALDGGPADPAVQARMRAVSEAELRGHIERLSGLVDVTVGATTRRIRSRSVSHPDIVAAEQYLLDRLAALGLAVRREAYLPDGGASTPPLANVEGTLRGAAAPDEVYVLAAHYDSTAKLTRGWNAAIDPAPGADDNASGTALVLEAARVLRDARPRATIRFVFFTAEEVGLAGSAAYVRAARARGEDLRFAISMDPVGNTGPLAGNLYFTYNRDSEVVAREAEAIRARYGLRIPVLAIPGDSPIIADDRSDHHAFWNEGYRALHGGTIPGDVYHTLLDTLEKVDLPFLADATSVVVALLAEAAGPIAALPSTTPTAKSGCAIFAGDPCAGAVGVLAFVAWRWLTRPRRRRRKLGRPVYGRARRGYRT
jgi:hypothetical protein